MQKSREIITANSLFRCTESSITEVNESLIAMPSGYLGNCIFFQLKFRNTEIFLLQKNWHRTTGSRSHEVKSRLVLEGKTQKIGRLQECAVFDWIFKTTAVFVVFTQLKNRLNVSV